MQLALSKQINHYPENKRDMMFSRCYMRFLGFFCKGKGIALHLAGLLIYIYIYIYIRVLVALLLKGRG